MFRQARSEFKATRSRFTLWQVSHRLTQWGTTWCSESVHFCVVFLFIRSNRNGRHYCFTFTSTYLIPVGLFLWRRAKYDSQRFESATEKQGTKVRSERQCFSVFFRGTFKPFKVHYPLIQMTTLLILKLPMWPPILCEFLISDFFMCHLQKISGINVWFVALTSSEVKSKDIALLFVPTACTSRHNIPFPRPCRPGTSCYT